jgi:hypothetical protein
MRSIAMPNLSCLRPVAILWCVSAVTSGLTRSATGARFPLDLAISASANSSGSDSMLNWPMLESIANAISALVLPTPENTILRGATPTASARRISPSDTVSAPAPSSANVRTTARFGLAFRAKATSASIPANAPANAWYCAVSAAVEYTYAGVPTASAMRLSGTFSAMSAPSL